MSRINNLDNLKGLAFILMFIQHIFYIYDLSNDFKTKLSQNILISNSGLIARSTFIFLAGYAVYLSYKKNKKNFIKKRLKRLFEIFGHALLLTLITFLIYPKYFVRFGILHFISLGTILLSLIAPYKILSIIILLLLIFIKIPKINPFIDTITGASVNYNMLDWFPLNDWFPYLILGYLSGPLLEKLFLLQNKTFLEKENILTYLGKNSLNFYTLHIIILLVFFKLKNNKKVY